MNNRVQRLLELMKATKHHAVLIHNPSNMFYLSGYTGEGCLFISGAVCAVVTDFRYTEQAENQAQGFGVRMTEKAKTQEDLVKALCLEQGVDKLFYEDDFLTVRDFEKLKDEIKGVEWKPVAGAPEQLRSVKDDGELALIEKACKITGDTFERLLSYVKAGMSEKEIACWIEYDMRSHGADRAAFSTIVAAGANGSLPHAVPSEYRLGQGDMVTVDFGAKVDGYCADMTRTFALGQPSEEMRKVYEVVQKAQQMAQDAVAAGKGCREIDSIARDYIGQQGYEGRFGHGLGHSLGIDVHETPRCNQQANSTFKEGQIMTVEPGIYLPGVGGVRIENTVVVTKDGCRSFTLPSRDLIIIS